MAKFIILMTAYVPLCKALTPLGWDVTLSRQVFLDSSQTEYTKLIANAIRKTLISSLHLNLIFVSLIAFSSELGVGINSIALCLFTYIAFHIIATNQVILSIFRNSKANIKSQNADVFLISIFPNLMVLMGYFLSISSPLFYVTMIGIGGALQIYLLTSLMNLYALKWQHFWTISRSKSAKAFSQEPRQLASILLIALNTRLPIIVASLSFSNTNFVLVDFMSKASFLIALVAWSGGVLFNTRYLREDHFASSVILKNQYFLCFLSWFSANALIAIFIQQFYNAEFNSWQYSLSIQILFIIVSLLDIPIAVGGYFLVAKGDFRRIIFAQILFSISLMLSLALSPAEMSFLVFYLLGSAIRSGLYMRSIRQCLT